MYLRFKDQVREEVSREEQQTSVRFPGFMNQVRREASAVPIVSAVALADKQLRRQLEETEPTLGRTESTAGGAESTPRRRAIETKASQRKAATG